MGLFRDDAGKTEKPTPQRLEEARKKGQVALSREFIMGGALVASVILLEKLGPWLLASLQEVMARGLDVHDAHLRLEGGDVPAAIGEMITALGMVAAPFATILLLGVALTALLAYGQIGVAISTEALGFKLERLNPIAGLQRILSPASFARTGMAAAKLAVLTVIPAVLVSGELQNLYLMFTAPELGIGVAYAAGLAMRVMFWVAVVVLAIAGFDVWWQRREHTQNLMMSKQEVDDERKRSEGDPLIKSRIRAAALKLARQRMLEAVPKADVVVTNPTHFSVALAYDRTAQSAPKVVAKGVDEVALRIRSIATDHGVPLMADPPLARALYRAVDVGTEIPERFYQAVAVVLGHVYRLRGKRA